ncbi:hypothetical protein D3C76_1713220 [compost metagenome]
MSVSVDPGETMLQRTPLPASSKPTVSARLFSAAFDAPYALIPMRGVCAASDATVTIAPPC